MKKMHVLLVVLLAFALLLLDYINLPTLLGLKTSHMNWELWMGTLNIVIVIALYIFTYKKLDERTIKREQNKRETSTLLLRECYRECKDYVIQVSQEWVEKFIIPKIDFDATVKRDSIIANLQNAPFENESTIMDYVKAGQLTVSDIRGYYKVKSAFRQYMLMRIILFDAPEKFMQLERVLLQTIQVEEEKLLSKV